VNSWYVWLLDPATFFFAPASLKLRRACRATHGFEEQGAQDDAFAWSVILRKQSEVAESMPLLA